MYRLVWGHPILQAVLRRGANFMIPDDHEFVDNFDVAIFHKRPEIMNAARKAYYEYQYQLAGDLTGPSGECAISFFCVELKHEKQNNIRTQTREHELVRKDHVTQFFRIGNTAIMMLDLRLQRAIVGDTEHPLLGPTQFDEFLVRVPACVASCFAQSAQTNTQTAFQAYATDPTVDHVIVATAAPLLYANEFLADVVHRVEGERMTSHVDMQGEVLRLLDAMSEHEGKVLLVGGDIHMYLDTLLENLQCAPSVS